MDITPQLTAVANERERLQPTPPVNTSLWWYDRNNREVPYACICTAIEAPGRIKVAITKPGAPPIHRDGVLYTGNAIHTANPNNPTTVNKGAFDYICGEKPPKSHLKPHEDALKKREENLYRDLEAFESAKRNRDERAAAQKAAKDAETAGV